MNNYIHVLCLHFCLHFIQVEKNKDYELVITNAGGFYRYRFGDVVKVVDFYNQCPVIEFQYR